MPIVVTLVAVAFVGIMAVSTFRRNVTWQVDSLVQQARLQELGEAAIAEVAVAERISQAYRSPANLAAFGQALETGTLIAGVLVPQGGAIQIDPSEVRQRLGTAEGLTLGTVQVRPVEYLVSRNLGRMRFQVEVEVQRQQRTLRRSLAQDFEFALLDDGGQLGFLLAKAPSARLYP